MVKCLLSPQFTFIVPDGAMLPPAPLTLAVTVQVCASGSSYLSGCVTVLIRRKGHDDAVVILNIRESIGLLRGIIAFNSNLPLFRYVVSSMTIRSTACHCWVQRQRPGRPFFSTVAAVSGEMLPLGPAKDESHSLRLPRLGGHPCLYRNPRQHRLRCLGCQKVTAGTMVTSAKAVLSSSLLLKILSVLVVDQPRNITFAFSTPDS